MCLGVPGRVVAVDGIAATVDCWGAQRTVSLLTVDEPVSVDDYVLVHVGFAIRRIPHEEVTETLTFYEQLIAATDSDLMAEDVQNELQATQPLTGMDR